MIDIEIQKAFKTSDGRLFTDKVEALQNEFRLELRGILNTGNPAKNDNYSSVQVAAILAKETEKVIATMKKYQIAINRATGERKKTENKALLKIDNNK